jgi:hypothetical protein
VGGGRLDRVGGGDGGADGGEAVAEGVVDAVAGVETEGDRGFCFHVALLVDSICFFLRFDGAAARGCVEDKI